jgi:hypothetical protein
VVRTFSGDPLKRSGVGKVFVAVTEKPEDFLTVPIRTPESWSLDLFRVNREKAGGGEPW